MRYDGGHKRDDDLITALAPHVRWVPVCPEVLAGLGVPRPPIRLVTAGADVRVQEVEAGTDRTAALQGAAEAVLAVATAEGVRGIVAKARSPSCGVGDAKRVEPSGAPGASGDGFVVAALRAAFPGLPVESEATLASAAAREAFLARLRAT